MKILVPIDGSVHSIAALKHLLDHLDWFRETPTIDLVCVQPPLPPRLPHMALTPSELDRYYQDEGSASLATARHMLERAGLPHSTHVLVGAPAESIVAQSRKSRADLIVLSTRGLGAAGAPMLGSVAVKVARLSTDVPVLVVNCGALP